MAKGKRHVDEDELEDEEDDEDYAADDLDDSEGGDEDEDGVARGGTSARGKKRKAPKFIDDAAEEDDDEEEAGRKAKKRSVFIDDIADVDDEDEDEEVDEEAEDLIDDRDMDMIPDEAGPTSAAQYRLMNRQRDTNEKTAEEIARSIEERYKQMDEGYTFDDGAALTQTGAVGQQGLLPTMNDPKLWMVHCRPGREREACVQLLQKHYTLHAQGAPLLIKSAIALDHLKGYIYVEAEKEAHVKDAVRGLRTMFISKGTRLVPLQEMVDAITVNRKAKLSIARDNWVRVRTGLYKDDLAKVVDVDFAAQKATIRLLPRLDLNAMATRDEETRKKFPFGRQGPVRPPAKPFNADEARQLGLLVTRIPGPDGTSYLQLGSHRFISGYTERDIAIKSLMVIEGVPPLEELSKFNSAAAAAEDEGRGGAGAGAGELSSLMAALPQGSTAARGHFAKGDRVIIIKGDLNGLEAVVDDIRDDGKILAIPAIDSFNERVDFDPEELRKLFKTGDRVRVLGGQHAGEVGMLISMQDQLCIVISDTTKAELKVFARDLSEYKDADTGVEALGDYSLHDLVQLDQTTAGVIIKVERDACKILTSNSAPDQADVRVCRLPDIQRKVNARNIITTDGNKNSVKFGNYVTITSGPGAPRMGQTKGGTVEYIWRGMLFLKGPEYADQGGFICVQAKNCRVRGGANQSSTELARSVAMGQAGYTPNRVPQSPGHPSMGSGLKSPAYGATGTGIGAVPLPPPRFGAAGAAAGGPGGFSGRSALGGPTNMWVGKMVRVAGGQYNGYRGRVKHETETHVQIEMEAIGSRLVTVPRTLIRGEGAPGMAPAGPGAPTARAGMPSQPVRGSMEGMFGARGRGGGDSQGMYGSQAYASATRTPLHPSQTPMHPSMTPAHPSMTPMHAPYTPMHAPTPGDDNTYLLRGGRDGGRDGHADRHHGGALRAATPGEYGGSVYTPAAYTPAMTPSGMGDFHHAPTPGGEAAPGGLAGTPALAPTPFMPAPTPALTPGHEIHTHAATPGDAYGTGFTPRLGTTPAGTAPTPGQALTPSMAHTPGTPGMEPLGALPNQEDYTHWEGVVVQLPNGSYGVVKSVMPLQGQVSVAPASLDKDSGSFVESGAPESVVEGRSLTLHRPEKKHRVKVLYAPADQAEAAGQEGTLIGTDTASGTLDGIVRLDRDNDVVIVDLSCLGRLARQVAAGQA